MVNSENLKENQFPVAAISFIVFIFVSFLLLKILAKRYQSKLATLMNNCFKKIKKWCSKVIAFVLRRQNNAEQAEENYVSDDNDPINPIIRGGNRIPNADDAQHQRNERRLMREINPIIAANIEIISQRFGPEIVERARALVENRRTQNVNRVLSLVHISELRSHIPDKDLGTFDESNAETLKTIINWYGSVAGILFVRFNNSNIKELKVDYRKILW